MPLLTLWMLATVAGYVINLVRSPEEFWLVLVFLYPNHYLHCGPTRSLRRHLGARPLKYRRDPRNRRQYHALIEVLLQRQKRNAVAY